MHDKKNNISSLLAFVVEAIRVIFSVFILFSLGNSIQFSCKSVFEQIEEKFA